MSEENAAPSRIQKFKNVGKNLDEMRRRRTTATVELRKTSRHEQILKKRNVDITNEPTSPLSDHTADNVNGDPGNVTTIIKVLKGHDTNKYFDAVQNARKILSREKNPPIDILIDAGIVPLLVHLLSPEFSHLGQLQFEACWALTNIASGTSEQTNTVIKEGALPKLVALLHSANDNVLEQAVWALGNISGDGPILRDLVLHEGALDPLIELAKPDRNVVSLRTIVWTISNLCRNKNPPPPFDVVNKCLPALRQMLFVPDTEVLADACWALSYLTDGSNSQIQAVVDSGVVPRLVQLLTMAQSQVTVLTPALRSVGNIVTGNEAQTDIVLKNNALPVIKQLLHSNKMNIVKEAAWTLSNITAGTEEQIQAVVDADVLPSLIHVLQMGDYKSQKEAAWAVTNFSSNSSVEQMSYLIQLGVLHPFCNLLGSKDWRVILVVLDGISNMLSKAETMGLLDKLTLMIEECGGLDKLEELQQHEQLTVYEKAINVMESYFNLENEDASLLPSSTDNGFQFNPSQNDGPFQF